MYISIDMANKKHLKKHATNINHNKNVVHIHIGDKKKRRAAKSKKAASKPRSDHPHSHFSIQMPQTLAPQFHMNRPQHFDPMTQAQRETILGSAQVPVNGPIHNPVPVPVQVPVPVPVPVPIHTPVLNTPVYETPFTKRWINQDELFATHTPYPTTEFTGKNPMYDKARLKPIPQDPVRQTFYPKIPDGQRDNDEESHFPSTVSYNHESPEKQNMTAIENKMLRQEPSIPVSEHVRRHIESFRDQEPPPSDIGDFRDHIPDVVDNAAILRQSKSDYDYNLYHFGGGKEKKQAAALKRKEGKEAAAAL